MKEFPSYKTVSVSSLIPYARNSRTHSDAQVGKIAASIKEFGFLNPVIVDSESGIIAGHGRVLAAQKLGMVTVPTITLAGLTDAQRRNGMKDCLCADCGTEFMVRKDTSPKVCKRCASVRGGKAMAGVYRVARTPCKVCATPIRSTLGQTYCSLDCRAKDKREARECKSCEKSFDVLKSAIGGKTNAVGNFCSRPCYEKWMCNTERVTGRGSQWLKARTEARKLNPFCALCGTRHGLQVHHVAPFRLTQDNGQDNLVPLCIKHHKIVESMTHDIERAGSLPADIKLIMGSMLREHQMATRAKLIEIHRART